MKWLRRRMNGATRSVDPSPWEIPPEFDATFLDWFRERTEALWASLPSQTLKKTLKQFVRAGVGGSTFQRDTQWTDGLSDDEIAQIERRWALRFPPDYRLFVQRLHVPDRPLLGAGFAYRREENEPRTVLARAYWDEEQDLVLGEEPSFYNWLTDVHELEGAVSWLVEGLEFDVEENDLWEPGWGPRPATAEERRARIRELVEAAPKLIPVIGHRYLLPEPCAAENPVLSVYQSDIVVYGEDLRDFLLHTLGDWLGLASGFDTPSRSLGRDSETIELLRSKLLRTPSKRDESYYEGIPFWGSLIG